MSGGFSAGFLKGASLSLIVVAAASLVLPLDPLDPGQHSQVDLSTPAESGFNAERSDTNPSLPVTDQTVVTEPAQRPDIPLESPDTPAADTSTADQPDMQGEVEMPAVAPAEDEVAVITPEADATPPSQPPVLGMPAPEIENPVTDIPVNRLPTIEPPTTEVTPPPAIAEDGTPDAPAVPTQPEVAELATPTAPVAGANAAFLRNRVAFDNPDGRPMMSIILIDARDEGLDTAVLTTFTFPISFAIDPDQSGATARAKILAREGFEILALAPGGANALAPAETPAAVAAVIQGVFSKLPEAVAIVDRPTAQIQQTAGLPEQVIEALNSGGQGLLTYEIGLNSADQKARKAGIYAGTVYRVLDAERESGTVIKRYLDRAVLEAGKDGHVIVLGHSYPETVTALFSWALSTKANTVALAPVSATMMAR